MKHPLLHSVFENELTELLGKKDKTLLFVGIGNILKSDDGVGVYISNNIQNSQRVRSLTVEVSIENYIGKINSLKPDILVLIDCLDMNSDPGTCKLLTLNQINDFTFNTHNISLKRLSEFFPMPVFILGIQPEKLDFGETISYIVSETANIIINLIKKETKHAK